MEIQQKHITTIRMHDAKGCDMQLCKEGQDYQLQLSSAQNVVTICMGLTDLRRLCQQIIQLEMDESWKSNSPPEFKSFIFNGSARPFHETVANWYGRMAGEMGERGSRR
jgi:hypothetical protein